MSFLGKFFAGKADANKDHAHAGAGDDGPPLPKKQVPTDTGAQPAPAQPKKKFEKPNLKQKEETEEPHEEQHQPDHTYDHQQQIEHTPEGTETQSEPLEASNQGGMSNHHEVRHQQTANTTPGKPLSFLEKMKLKREQEALEKSTLDNSQIQENSHHTDNAEEIHKPIETETKPKLAFMSKFRQPKEVNTEAVHANDDTVTPKEEADSHQESSKPITNMGSSKSPFKFLDKKKKEAQNTSLEDQETSGQDAHRSHHFEKDIHNHEETLSKEDHIPKRSSQTDLEQGNSAHNASEVESKPTPTKPRFGFLNKPKLQVDQDSSMNQAGSQNDGNQADDPNENTLNLSPVDKDKSFNVQGDLADTLDRYDSGGQTPNNEKKNASDAADFVKASYLGCYRSSEIARSF